MCVANNSVGTSSSPAANLTVQDVPDPPKDFKVISRGSQSVNISWTAGSHGNSAIQNYTVKISQDGQIFVDARCQGSRVANACVTYTTRGSIKELFPWTIYYLRVFARNMIGSSNDSSIINVTTNEEVPSSAPPFNASVISSTAVNVSWKMLSKQDARGEIRGYYILYGRKSDPQLSWKNRTVNRKETTSLVLSPLQKFTVYRFAIQAFNNMGVSVQSNVVERKTDQDKPSAAPKLKTAEPKNSTSIELTWDPVPERDLNGILTAYVIRYWDDKELPSSSTKVVENYMSEVVINGLRASTTYSFNISAATIKGEGPQSENKSATTKDPPVPLAPSDIGTSEASVAFKPRQALSSGNKVRYYQIIVVPLREGERPGKSSDENYVRVIRKYEDGMEGEPYITAEFSNNNERRKTFPVGDGKYYSRENHVEARRKRRAGVTEYLNGKLDDDTEYAVFQRSLSGPNDYENEGFARFKTLKEAEWEPEDKTVIDFVVFIVLFIVFVVVGGIVIVWLRGRRRSNENGIDRDIPMEDRGYGEEDDRLNLGTKRSRTLQINEGFELESSNGKLSTVAHHDLGNYMELNEVRSLNGPATDATRDYPEINEYAPLHPGTRSWEVERENVTIEKVIGKGAFGQVAQGKVSNLRGREETITVAIKMLKGDAGDLERKDLLSELEIMKKLKPHPHVIKLLGCVTKSDPLLVLIEYVPYGDLLGYLRKSRHLEDNYFKDPDIKPQTSLTSLQLMKFSWQVADGMHYLSSKNIIHRDLAARNVLVGERERCKVTDFGMARDVCQENIYERKSKGRLPVKWTASEALLYGRYTTKSDVWSFGIVLYEIFTIGGSPYPKIDGRKIAHLLSQGYRMPKPRHVDDTLYKIMQDCWQENPDDRPVFESLRNDLKEMENQHQRLINMQLYDNILYANVE